MNDNINLSGGIFPQVFGVFYVIWGALYSLTMIGAIVGVPAIFMGLAMFRGGSHAKAYCASQDDAEGVMAASEFMRSYRIHGIMTCIGLGLGLSVVVLYIVIIFMMGLIVYASA